MGNININGKSAVHAKSEGKLITTDVCLTPPFCVPIPYTNMAESKMTDMGASSVNIQGSPACNSKSNFKISQGDAPGVCAGASSGSIGQMAEFITFSNDVMIEGKPAVRNGDKMVSNMRNTAPQPLMQPPAGNAPAGTAKAPEALEKEEYSLRWLALDPVTGEPIEGMPYSIMLNGEVIDSGKTGADGRTARRMSPRGPEYLTVMFGESNWIQLDNEAVTTRMQKLEANNDLDYQQTEGEENE